MHGIRVFLILLLLPAFCFAQYKVVLKSGKVIEGKLLHEDQLNIYLESGGIKMNFKKEKLDLEKMKELNAKKETSAADVIPQNTVAPKHANVPNSKSKKPARVYTSEDVENMKQIWNAGAAQTGPSSQTEPSAEGQTAAPSAPEMQPQSMPALQPRDEQTIREEIERIKSKITETDKQIQDLRAKGRVTVTWEKLQAMNQEKLKDLDAELKEAVAARKAAKAAAKTQTQTQP